MAAPTPRSTELDPTYNARNLLVLEGLEAVRKRPGMYIGSTDSRGLMHCLWEIIDNAVDEALAGHGDRIDVVLHKDGSVEVARPRPRHPGRHRAEDQAQRRRGRVHQAARRRQVRRRVVQRLRWSARCRRLGGERAVRAAGRRGRPRRRGLDHVVPARCRRRVRRRGRERAVHARPRACARPAGRRRASPAPGSGTGPTGRSSPATRPSTTTSWSPGRGRRRSWCRGSSW